MKILFPALLLLFVASCSSPVKMMCNTWKVDDVQFLDSLNTFTPAQKEMLTKSIKTTLVFTFSADSSYQVRSSGEVHNNKWWLVTTKNGKLFYTTTPEGKMAEAKILELKKNYLQFESAGEENQSFRFTCSPIPAKK